MYVNVIYLIVVSACLVVNHLVRQLRIHLRDERDRELARHVFDQTRSTAGLAGYTALIEAKQSWIRPSVQACTVESNQRSSTPESDELP